MSPRRISGVHELSQAQARQIAVHAQLLTADRPDDLAGTVRGLGFLQLEPTKAIAPSAELVLWSRLGSAFDPADLWDTVDEQRLIELQGLLRPAEDLALFRAEMAAWPHGADERDWQLAQADWVAANNDCRLDLLRRLRADGPLPRSELPDTCVLPWSSSGWTNDRNVQIMLNQLVLKGEVAAAGGTGRHRLWDLAERVYPDDPVPPLDEARRLRDAARLRQLGIARPTGPDSRVEPIGVAEAGEPAVIEGLRGAWRVDPALVGRPFHGRAALLSPFDRLLADRKRMAEVFGFDYILEMYKPAAKRRWGYYALPVLYADRLVGKVDTKADRRAGVLEVYAVHQDVRFTKAMTAAVEAEIVDLARWLDVEVVRVED